MKTKPKRNNRPSSLLFTAATAIPLALATTSQAAVLVGFDGGWSSGGATATQSSNGASGSASTTSGQWFPNNDAASTDGTFGTLAGATTATGPASSGIFVRQVGGDMQFTITAGSTALTLEAFHFDAKLRRPSAPDDWSVEVIAGSSITVGPIGSGTLNTTLGGSPGPADHDDIDIDLTGLPDNQLAAAESATFQVSFSGGTAGNNGAQTFFDNVAVSGVPEPSTFSLLALALGFAATRRRR